MHEQRVVVRRPRVRRAVVPVAASYGWAVLCNLTVELLQSSGGWMFALKPALFLLGSTLIWIGMLAVWAVTGRLRVAAALAALVSVLLGYANHTKMVLRREPIYPDDFAVAQHTGFLEQMVGWGTIAAVVAVVILVVGLVLTRRLALATASPAPKGGEPARVRPDGGRSSGRGRGVRRSHRVRRPVQPARERRALGVQGRRRGVGLLVPGEELHLQRLRRRHALQPRRPGDEEAGRLQRGRDGRHRPAVHGRRGGGQRHPFADRAPGRQHRGDPQRELQRPDRPRGDRARRGPHPLHPAADAVARRRARCWRSATAAAPPTWSSRRSPACRPPSSTHA